MADIARLSHETLRAKQAFADYLAMGPGRSLERLAKTYQTYTKPRPPTVHLSTLKEWSAAWRWQVRCDVWDAENQRRQLEAAAAKMEAERRLLRDQQKTIGKALVGKAGEREQGPDLGHDIGRDTGRAKLGCLAAMDRKR